MIVVEKYFDKLRAEKTTPVSHQLVTDGQGQTIHESSSRDTAADMPMDVNENGTAASQPTKTPPENSEPLALLGDTGSSGDVPADRPAANDNPMTVSASSSSPDGMPKDVSGDGQLVESSVGGSAVDTHAGADAAADNGDVAGKSGDDAMGATVAGNTENTSEGHEVLMDININARPDCDRSTETASPKPPGYYHYEERERCIAQNRELMQQLGLVEDRDDLVKELNAKKKENAQQGGKKKAGKNKENVKKQRRSG